MKSGRNKTIDLSLEEGQEYLARCVKTSELSEVSDLRDKIICGDCFQALPHIPKQSVDLLIVDPPYNLTKDFHGSAFSAMSNEDYAAYTDR